MTMRARAILVLASLALGAAGAWRLVERVRREWDADPWASETDPL